jgi:hypothetical protein
MKKRKRKKRRKEGPDAQLTLASSPLLPIIEAISHASSSACFLGRISLLLSHCRDHHLPDAVVPKAQANCRRRVSLLYHAQP